MNRFTTLWKEIFQRHRKQVRYHHDNGTSVKHIIAVAKLVELRNDLLEHTDYSRDLASLEVISAENNYFEGLPVDHPKWNGKIIMTNNYKYILRFKLRGTSQITLIYQFHIILCREESKIACLFLALSYSWIL